MDTSAGSGARPREVAGSITSALIRHVRKIAGDEGVARVLDAAGWVPADGDPEDQEGWQSSATSGRMFRGAMEVCGDLDIGRAVGEEMIRHLVDLGVTKLYASLQSPSDLLRYVTTSGGKMATTTVTEAIDLAADHAVIRAFDRTKPVRDSWSCGISTGLLAATPMLLGMPMGVVTEAECQARGGSHCLYTVRWVGDWSSAVQQTDTDRTELPEVAALTRRLEALQETAAELTAAQDVDRVLALITERAGVAVRAPQFLLAVRTSPDDEPRVHRFGCSEEEATGLTRALLAGDLDEGDGARLIVDITSGRRHYGRLAAIFPSAKSFFPHERRLLAAYAGHAAAALDAATALDEARRDRDTAQALLELAGALARVGTRAEVAGRLASAVPAVVGCERANVWLWDSGARSLRLAGRSWADRTITDLPTVLAASDVPGLDDLIASPRPMVIASSSATGVVRAFMERTDVAASVIVPIVAHGQFLGLVAAEHRDARDVSRTPRRFDRLVGLADQAATALANADLLERIRHQALHDGLTGLPNRPLLEDRVNLALRQAHRTASEVSLLFLDLDRFKNVNDTLGHRAGDELIRQVAHRLSLTMREADTLARLGGDEFVILLGGPGGDEAAESVAGKVMAAIRQPFFVAEHELYISASIGIVHAPRHGNDYETLLQRADTAMYDAKALGRNIYQTYAAKMSDSRREALLLESNLHTALDRQELVVLYQPQVDLRTMRVSGVEALVRWDHPELGRLGPDRFIPLAEETGVIVDIDRWVLDEACRQGRAWLDAGVVPLRIAVNLSTRDVRDPELAPAVAETLARHRFPAELLELEITDRVVMEDDETLVGILEQLKALGVRLAIDDFGTGTSVLRRLERCPVDTLKIDKGFVQEITSDTSEAAVVSALISMAERLGMEIVAEGVETAVQGGFLRRRGCHLAQGFFFAHPLAPADVERLVALTTRPETALVS